jgi:hypothetical protein
LIIVVTGNFCNGNVSYYEILESSKCTQLFLDLQVMEPETVDHHQVQLKQSSET